MPPLDEILARLDHIEEQVTTAPGTAQDDLETLLIDLGDTLADRQEQAHARLHNEDFPGAAHLLGENALAIQRTAVVALELREEIRRRR